MVKKRGRRMKITDERKPITKKFIELNCGDVFSFHNLIYMRMSNVWNEKDTIIANAVAIKSGEDEVFCDDALVEPLDTELIIKGVSV